MNNRKHITYSEYYKFNEIYFEINTTKSSGCFTPILQAGINTALEYLDRYKRIFVYFFALHSQNINTNSTHTSRFFDKARIKIKRTYDCNLGYVWVREQNKAETPHYHVMIVLDGDKIRHSKKLNILLKDIWEKGSNGANYLRAPENPFYNVRTLEELKEVIWRFSYNAKEKGKDQRPPQSKDFNSSRKSKASM